MYLVLCRHTRDDIPVKLCGTLEEAKAEAVQWVKRLEKDPVQIGLEGFEGDSPISVAILRFHDGVPVDHPEGYNICQSADR